MPGFDERCLDFVHEVCAAGGVRAAGDRLGVDPSVVSRQIAQAEMQLHMKLFERVGRRIVPTEAGWSVSNYVADRRLMQANLQAHMDDLRNLRSGHVSIACGEGLVAPLIRGPLAKLQHSYPNVRFRVEARSVAEMNLQLINGDIDLALSHGPPRDPATRTLYKRTLAIDFIATPDHPLIRVGRPISVDALCRCPLALLPSGYGIRGAMQKIEEAEGVTFDDHFVSNTLIGLLAYVTAGFSATLMPALVPSAEIRAGKLVALPVENSVLRNAELHLLVRNGRTMPPTVAAASKEISHAIRTNFNLE